MIRYAVSRESCCLFLLPSVAFVLFTRFFFFFFNERALPSPVGYGNPATYVVRSLRGEQEYIDCTRVALTAQAVDHCKQ